MSTTTEVTMKLNDEQKVELKGVLRSSLMDRIGGEERFEQILCEEVARMGWDSDDAPATIGNIATLGCRSIIRGLMGDEMFDKDLNALDREEGEAELDKAMNTIIEKIRGVSEDLGMKALGFADGLEFGMELAK